MRRTLLVLGCLGLLLGACKKKPVLEDDGLGSGEHFDELGEGAAASEDKDVDFGELGHRRTATQPFSAPDIHLVFEENGEPGIEAWTAEHGATVVVLQKGDVDHTVVWHENKALAWTSKSKKVARGTRRPAAARLSVLYGLSQRKIGAMGFAKTGTEHVAGRECDVWRNDKLNVTVWNWAGVDLQYLKGDKAAPSLHSLAVLVEEGGGIPDDLLTPPDGYE